MNGKRLMGNNYGLLIEQIGMTFENSPIWKELQYNVSLLVDQPDTSFVLRLQCILFHSIWESVNAVSEFTINLYFSTDQERINLTDMLHDTNYLVNSWILHMEDKFPLVLSYYGRHLFKLNYYWIKKSIDEMLDPSLLTLLNIKEAYDSHSILLSNLLKLQKLRMVPEFNTINVLLEMSKSKYRYLRVKEGLEKNVQSKPEEKCVEKNLGQTQVGTTPRKVHYRAKEENTKHGEESNNSSSLKKTVFNFNLTDML